MTSINLDIDISWETGDETPTMLLVEISAPGGKIATAWKARGDVAPFIAGQVQELLPKGRSERHDYEPDHDPSTRSSAMLTDPPCAICGQARH